VKIPKGAIRSLKSNTGATEGQAVPDVRKPKSLKKY
jgi:hypothetical protein